jgi:hypothetical protein
MGQVLPRRTVRRRIPEDFTVSDVCKCTVARDLNLDFDKSQGSRKYSSDMRRTTVTL